MIAWRDEREREWSQGGKERIKGIYLENLRFGMDIPKQAEPTVEG